MDRKTGLVTKLLEIAEATRQIGFECLFDRKQDTFMTHDKVYGVDPKVHAQYQRFPEALLKENESGKRFSLTTTESIMQESIARLVDGQPTIESAVLEVEGLLRTLSEDQPEQVGLYEVPGIVLPKRSRPYLLAGAKVTRMSSRDYDSLVGRCKRVCSGVSKKGAYSAMFKPHLDRLKGKTVMWCSYAAETNRAQKLSLETLDWVIILLKYACMALTLDNNDMAIGIRVVPSVEYFIIPKESDSIRLGAQATGKYMPWQVRSSDRDRMYEAGVFVLSDIVVKSRNAKKPDPKSFESALLQALQWTVTSLDLVTNGSKIVALAVALETIFSPYASSSLTSTIAEGTAMTISRDPAKRQQVCERMIALYKMRSDSVHGYGDNASDWDVLDMGHMVTSVISVLCRHVDDYNSLADFSKALLKAKLTGRVFKEQ